MKFVCQSANHVIATLEGVPLPEAAVTLEPPGGVDGEEDGTGAAEAVEYEDGVPGVVAPEGPGLAEFFTEHVGAANAKGRAAKRVKGMANFIALRG